MIWQIIAWEGTNSWILIYFLSYVFRYSRKIKFHLSIQYFFWTTVRKFQLVKSWLLSGCDHTPYYEMSFSCRQFPCFPMSTTWIFMNSKWFVPLLGGKNLPGFYRVVKTGQPSQMVVTVFQVFRYMFSIHEWPWMTLENMTFSMKNRVGDFIDKKKRAQGHYGSFLDPITSRTACK